MWRDRKLFSRLAAVARWLHIYLSMFAFAALVLFSATGLTLNHPDWFSAGLQRRTLKGEVPSVWLQSPLDTSQDLAARGEIVEHLRRQHSIQGAVAEFTLDEQECLVAFKGPGYAADVFIDRSNGAYEATEIRHGTIAVLNDLHKGRHTGSVWSWVIDLSAVGMILVGVTGLVLLLFIRRRRRSGLLIALAGTVAVAVAAWLLTP
jgi:hypothetical protein